MLSAALSVEEYQFLLRRDFTSFIERSFYELNPQEHQVALRLQSFLQSGKDVMDQLCLPDDPAAQTQQLMAGATKQSQQLSSASPKVVKDFVRKVMRGVVVHLDRLQVEVSKPELCAALIGQANVSSPE